MLVQIRNRGFSVVEDEFAPFWNAVARGAWEAESLDILDRFLSPGAALLDLGCHMGALSLYAAAGGARVLAVDPDPEAGRMFLNNVSLNPGFKGQVHFVEAALGPCDGRASLFVRKRYGLSSSSLLHRAQDRTDAVEVRTMSLPTLIRESSLSQIDLIKMDIEGGEFLVLPRLAAGLAQLQNPVLYVSFHLPYLVEHLFWSRFGSSRTARLAEKLARRAGLRPFRNAPLRSLQSILEALAAYKFIYRANGEAIDRPDIPGCLLVGRDEALVFSNRPW